MTKPFCGVIKNWAVINGRVSGEVEADVLCDPAPDILTSEIVTITPINGTTARRLETRNSIYILI